MENKSSSSQDIIFILLGCVFTAIAILGISIIPKSEISPSYSEVRSEKSKYLSDPKGYPDKFREYFRAIEGLDQGYQPYPQGYQIREHQRALQKNAKNARASVNLAWVERGPGNNGGRSRAVIQDPGDPSLNTWFVASVGGGVWRGQLSTRYGLKSLEWTPLTDDLPTLAATTLAMSANHPDVMYVGTGEGFFNLDASAGTGIFRSDDRGQSWIQLSSTVDTQTEDWRYVNRLIVHPDNPDIVVAATNAGIYRTENGGQSFVKVHDSEYRVQDLKAHPTNFDIQFAAVDKTEILRSTDGGKTWETVFDFFRYPPDRIELAISQSNPDVIWASVNGANGRSTDGEIGGNPISLIISELYRSVDGGQSWRYLQHSEGTEVSGSIFLFQQGWYNNSLLVHPFFPDSVFIGGVWLSKAWINPQSDPVEPALVGVVTDFKVTANFIDFVSFRGSGAQGRVEIGYLDSEENDIQDITVDDVQSVEVRFGPGLSQKAHRFTVQPGGGTNGDGGAGIFLPEYIYEDYVEVPFEVWDTDNNRQLMISFRDQAADGKWSLIALNTAGPGSTHSREYVFISKYDYDDTAPHPDIMTDGGVRMGMMYNYWPVLRRSGSGWDPNDPSQGTIEIIFRKELQATEIVTIDDWEETNEIIHVDHHALVAIPTEQGNFQILNTNDGGFAYSLNNGENWREGDTSPGFNTSQFYDATKQPGLARYIGGTQDNSTWISGFNPNSKSNWDEELGGDGFDVVWKSADSLIGTSQNNNISRTVDGGDTWESAGNIDDWSGQFFTSLGWTPETGEAVFAYSPEGGPLRSLNFGNSWHQLYPDWSPIKGRNAVTGGGGKVRVSIADPSVVWAGNFFIAPRSPGNLHVFEDALNSLPKVRAREVNRPDGAPVTPISGLATHPFTRATAYVMFSAWCQPKLFRTEDLGESWEQLSGFPEDRPRTSTAPCPGSSNGFPNAKVYDLEVFDHIPWVMWGATDLGIYESRDHGETWAYADNGLPAVSVWRIRVVDDEIILATHGRGVWTLPLDQVITHAEQDGLEIPDSFELIGNYPNPFNPTTNIEFRVANASHIRVDVFDILGRKVATLTDQPYESGSHQIQWDASSISSGQYIYRMEADGKIIGAKSMVLVK